MTIKRFQVDVEEVEVASVDIPSFLLRLTGLLFLLFVVASAVIGSL